MPSRLLLPIVGAALMWGAVQTPQFKTSTELVRVYATVQDKTTKLVSDLTQDDFVVTDNGKVMPIAVFSNDISPFSAIVMLDRSGSMYPHQFEIRDAAMAFVQKMLPADKVRIGSFGDGTGNRVIIRPSTFSSSREELLDILRVPIAFGQDSPVYISIDQSITALANRDDRSVVLIFTDGYDQPARTLLPITLKDLVNRAREMSVMIYAIGFTDVRERTGKAPEITPPEKNLRLLADDSGGGYFEVRDPAELTGLFTRVAEELHRQYFLGFTPPANDGKIHTIKVTTKRADLIVRARQTYQAGK
jgi:VWFA-related protein